MAHRPCPHKTSVSHGMLLCAARNEICLLLPTLDMLRPCCSASNCASDGIPSETLSREFSAEMDVEGDAEALEMIVTTGAAATLAQHIDAEGQCVDA